jgi:hypothetical protein
MATTKAPGADKEEFQKMVHPAITAMGQHLSKELSEAMTSRLEAQLVTVQGMIKASAPAASSTSSSSSSVSAQILPTVEETAEHESRLRGGAQRVHSRLADVQRRFVESGQMTPETFAMVTEALNEATSKVPHKTLPSVSLQSPLHVHAKWGARLDKGVLDGLSEVGLSGVPPGDVAANILVGLITAKTKKELSSGGTFTSYADFCKRWRDLGWITRKGLAEDPDRYHVASWLKDCVEYLQQEYTWPIAKEYHRRVMEHIQLDHWEPTIYAEGDSYMRGDIEGALHQGSFVHAMKKSSSPATQSSNNSWKGTSTQVNPNDTYCGIHKKWFLQEKDHSWDLQTSTGTCSQGKKQG